MNLVDLLLVAVIVASIWGGARRGLVLAAADLVALVAAVVSALLLYARALALATGAGFEPGVWSAPLAFIAIYVLTRMALGIVLGRLVRAVPRAAHAHRANRALGMLPGLGNGLINATIASMLILALPLSDTLSAAARESVLTDRLAAPAEWLDSRLRPIFNPAVEQTLTRLTVKPGSRERVELPFTVRQTRPRPDLEAQMLELVNEERRARGLRPLAADPETTKVARAHSRDMFARGYFSHITPENEDPFDRMREGGLRFLAAGENLALARTLPMAHQGLMDSPGHRANILRGAFGRVGIGVIDGGRYGLMVTQNFRN